MESNEVNACLCVSVRQDGLRDREHQGIYYIYTIVLVYIPNAGTVDAVNSPPHLSQAPQRKPLSARCFLVDTSANPVRPNPSVFFK